MADAGENIIHSIIYNEVKYSARFSSTNKIYAYNMWTNSPADANVRMFDGSRDEDKDIQLRDGNTFAQGLWSDGETIWVADFQGKDDDAEKKIYAYNMTTQDRDSEKDYNTLNEADNDRPRGIWSDGETMWVADQTDNKLYAYHALALTSRNEKQDFGTLKAVENKDPRGIWSDGETMWVADDLDNKLYAYDLANKDRDSNKEIATSNPNDLLSVDLFKSYIWSDGTNMWVSSFDRKHSSSKPTDWTSAATNREDDTAGIYAFNLSDGSRDDSKDFTTNNLINANLTYRGNDRPRGLWSDGKTMWVAERDDYSGIENTNKIYAYDLATKARVPNQDFNTLHEAGNRAPAGLWSDGETMWVGDDAEDKIYDYNLVTKARDAAKDYDTLAAAGNQHLAGLWSDGETMWVADSDDNKVYAYNRAVEARLGDLLVTGHVPSSGYENFVAELDPTFNSGVMEYDFSVPFATERLTLRVKGEDAPSP